jgi:hypothetical protein
MVVSEEKLAEVVGSTPTQSTSFILVEYGIEFNH